MDRKNNLIGTLFSQANETQDSDGLSNQMEQDFKKEIEFVTGDEWKAGNLSYHLKSRPKWEGYNSNEILNKSSQFICIDNVCLGRY